MITVHLGHLPLLIIQAPSHRAAVRQAVTHVQLASPWRAHVGMV